MLFQHYSTGLAERIEIKERTMRTRVAFLLLLQLLSVGTGSALFGNKKGKEDVAESVRRERRKRKKT